MNLDQDPMQNTQTNQNLKVYVQNTLTTDNSKRDTEIDPDQNFKSQRQKYLQQRKNRRQQVKTIRKQQFGSSSSQSEEDHDKNKPTAKIIKNSQSASNPKIANHEQKTTSHQKISKTDEDQFHVKHQAYIKEKLARKKQMFEQKKKQFGSSSSQSDQQFPIKVEAKLHAPPQQNVSQKSSNNELTVPVQPSKQRNPSPLKKSMDNINVTQKPSQAIYIKNQNPIQSKKITILTQSKKNLQWIEETMIIENKRIKFINQNLQFFMAYVLKMKLYFTSVNKEYFSIKITHKNQDYFFAASTTKLIDQVPEYYYVFSKIIQDKMTLIGFEPKKIQASLFPNYMNLKDIPQSLKSSAMICGNILKKSQVLGNWQTRFVYITAKEIGSSKKPSQKPSMIISGDSISQLWTRFDVQNNSMLNIKIMYSSTTKTQFGIPLSCYTDQYNWLYCFYSIIAKNGQNRSA